VTVSAPAWTLPMISAPDFLSRTDFTEAAARVVAEAARAEGVREVEELIATGRKMDAVYKALEVYGINASHVKELAYDPGLAGDAYTWPNLSVRIGDDSFKSAAWLGSVLSHEIDVHIDQFRKMGDIEPKDLRLAVMQVEAFDHHLATAERFGLSKDEIAEVKDRRDSWYDGLDGDYKRRVDEGIYEMKPGDELE